MRRPASGLALAALLLHHGAGAEDVVAPVDTVVVTGSRVEHARFDLPASLDVVDAARIGDGQARVNASESLAAIPGVVALNRQNYAQDLQISVRGFGARSAFGVRGVQLIADGIPATMPDGQGQAATFDLDMAARIEVLRGPFSALYGNHSGGVVQMFTRDGAAPASLEARALGGSFGQRKTDVSIQGQSGAWSYLGDSSEYHTDGFRPHSAASREQQFAKLRWDGGDTRLTLLGNGLRQHDTQDALGVTLASWQRDPRATDPAAAQFNTRKSITHAQGGLNLEHRAGADEFQFVLWSGERQVTQFQAIPKPALAPPASSKSSGGVVDFERAFSGATLRWSRRLDLAGGQLTSSAGLDLGQSRDNRRGYDNYVGNVLGVIGRLRRDEVDDVRNVDPYAQIEWRRGAWALSAGLRHSRVDFKVDDHYLANGNDGGRVSYGHTTPLLGLLWQATPRLNLYASAARGFETPTLNELFYSGAGGTFNFNLRPAQSRNLEFGLKARPADGSELAVAVFDIATQDELVVDQSIGGRTSYRNAARTRRHGIEASYSHALMARLSTHLAWSTIAARYDEAFVAGGTRIGAGNRIPGIPAGGLFADLLWTQPERGIEAALELVARGRIFVEDSNPQAPAAGDALLNARIGAEQDCGAWRLKEFVRVDNLGDRHVIGSVIVGDSNQRYYEPAPGRAWLIGASARLSFN